MSLDPYFEPGDGGDNAFTVEAPKIKFGPGSLREIGDDAKALGLTRVAFYTDPTVAKLEPVAIATKSLKATGIDFFRSRRSLPAAFPVTAGSPQIPRTSSTAWKARPSSRP